jgi:hypothetical protein
MASGDRTIRRIDLAMQVPERNQLKSRGQPLSEARQSARSRQKSQSYLQASFGRSTKRQLREIVSQAPAVTLPARTRSMR